MKNLVTEQQAKEVLAAVVAALPNLPQPSAQVISYAPYAEIVGDKKPWMIVWPNGFQCEVNLLAMSMSMSPGWWPMRLKLEYDSFTSSHMAAMDGTDEPYRYTTEKLG